MEKFLAKKYVLSFAASLSIIFLGVFAFQVVARQFAVAQGIYGEAVVNIIERGAHYFTGSGSITEHFDGVDIAEIFESEAVIMFGAQGEDLTVLSVLDHSTAQMVRLTGFGDFMAPAELGFAEAAGSINVILHEEFLRTLENGVYVQAIGLYDDQILEGQNIIISQPTPTPTTTPTPIPTPTLTPTPTPIPTPTPTLLGDITGDGAINQADVNRLRSFLVGRDVYVNEENADLNNDGQVNVLDLTLLRLYLAGRLG